MVKLQDHLAHWTDLEQGDNPFATVVLAHLQTPASIGLGRSAGG
jgi:hypothetical protein